MSFSIIIPTFNYGALIEQSLDSVLGQSFTDWEMIVIDDGSTDNTGTIMSRVCARDSRVKYLKQVNQGPAKARNQGIDASQGDYLLFLDADDKLCDGVLSDIHTHFLTHPTTECLLGAHESIDDKGRIDFHPIGFLPTEKAERFKLFLYGQLRMSHGAFACRRSVFANIRYPESFRATEDLPVFAHLLGLFECDSLDRAFVRIYKHSDSLRHQSEAIETVALEVVDAVFESALLPESYGQLRQKFLARRCLSLFRSAYKAGKSERAKRYFHQAVSADLAVLLQFSYVMKYVRLLFKS